MEWLTENWIFVALVGGMAAMHLVGHRRGGGGCCGGGGHGHGEGGCGKTKEGEPDETSDRDEPRA